jgi:hypothetical protein
MIMGQGSNRQELLQRNNRRGNSYRKSSLGSILQKFAKNIVDAGEMGNDTKGSLFQGVFLANFT